MNMFRATRPQLIKRPFFAKTAAVMNVITASLPVQGTKGVRNMVSSLAFFDYTILAPRTEATLHPNPRHMGRKLFPCRPMMCMNLSITKAARAM